MEKFKIVMKILVSELKGLDHAQRKRLISALVAVAVVIGLAALPGLATSNAEESGPQTVIMEGEAAVGSITQELRGGGTLSGASPVQVRLPDGVKLTEFLVDNYATVKAGDPLATVDKVSVLSAISTVQDKLDELADAMADADDGTASAEVEAQSKGTVKAVYAQKGDDVPTVMAEHGALAVISIDGLMAVKVETQRKLSAGDRVWVAIGDTEVAGTVESCLDDTLVVTVTDKDYPIGEEVTVTDGDDKKIGSGSLYVHQPWNAVAYSGTVSAVNIKENGSVSAGKTLFKLKNVDKSGTFNALHQEHAAYEKLHQELFVMYQSGALLAPCDGMVSGVDKTSVHLLSADGAYEISLLADNTPDGTKDTLTNYVGYVALIGSDGWEVYMNTQEVVISDYMKELQNVTKDSTTMTTWSKLKPVTVYELVSVTDETTQTVTTKWEQVQQVAVGDILLFAGNTRTYWAIRVGTGATGSVPAPSPTPGGDSTNPGGGSGMPSGGGGGGMSMPSGGGGMSMGGGTSGFGGMGTSGEEEDSFDVGGTNILAVIPQTEMTMSIQVDEQDIAKLRLGQTADIQVDVLLGQSYTATVTEIGTTGTSDGGNAKYTVELTMDWAEDLLPGMSATASFTLGTTENVLTVPVAALVDTGTETVVYTKKSGDELKKPVTVTTGVSDGETVEITSGLTEGKRIYYSYVEENPA